MSCNHRRSSNLQKPGPLLNTGTSEEGRSQSAKELDELDIHEDVMRKWVRELRDEPQEAFLGNGKLNPDAEIAQLRKKVAELKMERDILKNLAYFAKESM